MALSRRFHLQPAMPSFRIISHFLFVTTILLSGCERAINTNPATYSSPKAGEAHESAKEYPSAAQQKAQRTQSQQRHADQKLAEIKRRLAENKRFTPEIVESLQRLRSEAPDHDPTLELLTSAYITREDWNALAELLRTKPSGERTLTEQLQLAKVLVKAQQFREAFELSSAVLQAADAGTNAEAAWIAAYSAFHLGDSRAADILDANFERLIAAGRFDAYVVRALIHFKEGELSEAEALLTTLLEQHPSHAPGHDALGRVLVAAGDTDRGNRHLQRATDLRNQLTRNERTGLRLSAMSQALRTAWQQQDYDACDRFITQMLVDANTKQQSQLYQQLAALRAAQGREQEAREALAKAKQLAASSKP